MRRKARERPAETTTGLAGAIVLILAVLGVEVDESALVAVIAGISALPAIVSAIVDRVRGV